MGSARWLVAGLLSMVVGTAARARADSNADAAQVARPRLDAAASARNGLTLPVLVAPGSATASRATAVFVSGYDSAQSSPVLRSYADVNLYGRLDARVGITYLPQGTNNAVQPNAGLRLRILNEDRSGLDLGVGVFYRKERFSDDDGEIQALLTAAKHFGRLGLFGNLAYGQDPEGDDRDGDVILAMLYEVTAPFQLGLESRMRFDLDSTDPRRKARGQSSFDGSFAPTASYSFGPIALVAQAGLSLVHASVWRPGALALAGLAAAY